MTDPILRVVVMGVAGAGKTTVGTRLADELGVPYVDADSAHPPENIVKMTDGAPLTDDDRAPWLRALRDRLRASDAIVVTCSALRRTYRDVLREAGSVRFVFLDVEPAVARDRLESRTGHFMTPGMVDSQFDTLERPGSDETDVFVVDATRPVAEVVPVIVDGLTS